MKVSCVEFDKNNNPHNLTPTALVFLLSNCPQVLNIVNEWPVEY